MTAGIDTNVLVRLLVRDHDALYAAARRAGLAATNGRLPLPS